jgi:hypothetical protein
MDKHYSRHSEHGPLRLTPVDRSDGEGEGCVALLALVVVTVIFEIATRAFLGWSLIEVILGAL